MNSQTPTPARIAMELALACPHCSTHVVLTAVQGDRCSGCNFEFTLFEPGQDPVAGVFYEVLTGAKYDCDLPGGLKVIVHG